MSIWQFVEFLPEVPAQSRISLGEGNTPLVHSQRIGPSLGLTQLYFKLESTNPTGSYKDRYAAMAVSDMRRRKISLSLGTSSGNAGAAMAAYCAAANMRCHIAIVETTPAGKRGQMQAYGARLFSVRGFGRSAQISMQVIDYLKRACETGDAALQISAFSYAPQSMTGVQTISYELAEQMPDGIDHVFCPVAGGGLFLAVARGFQGLRDHGRIDQVPALHCVQPDGNDTVVTALCDGDTAARQVNDCTTTISGLQVPQVLDGNEVVTSCRDSGGSGYLVSDELVYDTQKRLAREEGIFCEPAAAAALAGVLAAHNLHPIIHDARIVCLITGSGFKDIPSIERMNCGAEFPMLDSAQQIEQLIAGTS